MALSESARIVIDRIQQLEPEHVRRIIGYLFLQEPDEQKLATLAMSPDVVLQQIIYEAKVNLPPISPSITLPPQNSGVYSQVSPRPMLSPGSYRVQPPIWETAKQRDLDFMPFGYMDSMSDMENHRIFGLEEQMEALRLRNPNGFYSDAIDLGDARDGMGYRRGWMNDFPVKNCHYFNKGFCKHGSSCRYFHGQLPESFPQMFGHLMDDDHTLLPGSLENLEMEIVELLKSRRGNPVSIASLPTVYFERYGKNLQAEGYLTESQRHGKAGYSLTKLLARLKNSIRLIDRPHGQHAVILVEDASKYMESRNDRNDPGPIVNGSRQIYLTFPAESIFTEDDVAHYFSTYGPVEDVRIPCQQKRMFGFVTFTSPITVHAILSKGNPHFVCGARVLVKPYREKSKLVDRKYQERYDPSVYYPPQYGDMDFDFHSVGRNSAPRLVRKHLMEERERVFELERKRLAELHFAGKSPMPNYSYIGYSMDTLKESDAERFNYVLDVLNNSPSDEKFRHSETTYAADQDGDVLNLPDSPFASSNL
ncbi:hypothetical protein ACFE04_023274 [Oxalis oulophora]